MDTTKKIMEEFFEVSNECAKQPYIFKPVLPQIGGRGLEPQQYERFKRLDEIGEQMKKTNYHQSVPNFLQQVTFKLTVKSLTHELI